MIRNSKVTENNESLKLKKNLEVSEICYIFAPKEKSDYKIIGERSRVM